MAAGWVAVKLVCNRSRGQSVLVPADVFGRTRWPFERAVGSSAWVRGRTGTSLTGQAVIDTLIIAATRLP
jgi:hypothetical protein